MSATRIVVANPCDAERKLLGHLLSADGFKVREVAAAKDVVDHVASGNADLVILDTLNWTRPALNTLTALKTGDASRAVPVIMFGVPSTRDEVTEAIQAGAATWIGRKGFEVELFIEKIRAVLARARSEAITRTAAPASDATAKPSAEAGPEKLDRQAVVSALKGRVGLPAFEFSITEAITTTCSKDNAVSHLTDIVQRDPLLTVDVLAWANHIPGESGKASLETHNALDHLTARRFYKLAESIEPLTSNPASLWDPGCYWAHSVATSRIAALLSKLLGLGIPAEAANAGLLHDLGYFMLATHFPTHFGRLFTVGGRQDSVTPAWEKELIGAHHGEIGAWVMDAFGLPKLLQDVTLIHHGLIDPGHTLTMSARLLAMIVQAADQIAGAMFPADPFLCPLEPVGQDFHHAAERADLNPAIILDMSRQVVADLVTELEYLFPQSASRNYYYAEEPLEQVMYYAPGEPFLDTVQTFLAVRSEDMNVLAHVKDWRRGSNAPLVVNLTHLEEAAAQVETVTSMVAVGLMDGRRCVVLLDEQTRAACQPLVPDACRLITPPSHPARWFRWLTEGAKDESATAPAAAVA